MTKKTKRLYDRMQHGLSKKKDAIEDLKNKRKDLEEPVENSNKKKKKN